MKEEQEKKILFLNKRFKIFKNIWFNDMIGGKLQLVNQLNEVETPFKEGFLTEKKAIDYIKKNAEDFENSELVILPICKLNES